MYSQESKIIYGISQNCFDNFAIPSSLIYGNAGSNELRLDTIIPNLDSLDEAELKGPNGAITEIDST